jgi:hypothetical protein
VGTENKREKKRNQKSKEKAFFDVPRMADLSQISSAPFFNSSSAPHKK